MDVSIFYILLANSLKHYFINSKLCSWIVRKRSILSLIYDTTTCWALSNLAEHTAANFGNPLTERCNLARQANK